MISVIIPAYNYAKFLPDALNSLLQQSFTDWECIIINNGSHDNTDEVAKLYLQKDHRFKYFSIENKGVSNSRNFALQHVTGAYIQFLDADDLLEMEKLKTQVEFLNQHHDVDLVYGEARYFTTENINIRKFSMDENDSDWMPCISGKGKELINRLLKGNIMPINSAVFRKSLIEKCGAMDEQLQGYEDWELFLRFSFNDAFFQFLKAPDTNALIRSHPESLSKKKGNMSNYLFTVLQKTVFNQHLNLPQRIYVLIRYYQQFYKILFARISNRSALFINSNTLGRRNIIGLNTGAIFYLPFFLIVQSVKKIVK